MIKTEQQNQDKHAHTLPRGTVDWQVGMAAPKGVTDGFDRILRQTPLSPDSRRFLFRASLPDGE